MTRGGPAESQMVARYRVKIPSPLLSYTLGHDEVIVTLPELSPDHAPPLRAIVAALDSSFPGLRFRMVDEQNRLRQHINLWIGQDPVTDLAAPVTTADEITIMQALSGG